MTEITSSINSRVRLWKINHLGPGCSFYEFYEWYIFQKNTRLYIINNNILWPIWCSNNFFLFSDTCVIKVLVSLKVSHGLYFWTCL